MLWGERGVLKGELLPYNFETGGYTEWKKQFRSLFVITIR